MTPDEQALGQDLGSMAFVMAADRGWWHPRAHDGVVAVIDVTSSNGRTVTVRVDCAGYPGQAPTGALWDPDADAPLANEKWPTGGRASQVFNPAWSNQFGGAFYMPLDRKAQPGHETWTAQAPAHAWTINSTIVDFLVMVREVLRSATGPNRIDQAETEAS